jgi:hypothetical protein
MLADSSKQRMKTNIRVAAETPYQQQQQKQDRPHQIATLDECLLHQCHLLRQAVQAKVASAVSSETTAAAAATTHTIHPSVSGSKAAVKAKVASAVNSGTTAAAAKIVRPRLFGTQQQARVTVPHVNPIVCSPATAYAAALIVSPAAPCIMHCQVPEPALMVTHPICMLINGM